jgi:5-formyltetrahydrofolate cyclo-ligase
MDKRRLRKEALARRVALLGQEVEVLNEKLLNQFKTINFSKVNSIHIFLPIVVKKEPNTFLMIEWLQQHHPEIVIVVPKADFSSNLMENYVFTKKEDLTTNQYQIPEPREGKTFLTVPDMVIVPLLAFDEKGYRVGYGKGFYDRFLQGISTQKIGLSFFNAVAEINDVHLNDIKLDKCITPNGIVAF